MVQWRISDACLFISFSSQSTLAVWVVDATAPLTDDKKTKVHVLTAYTMGKTSLLCVLIFMNSLFSGVKKLVVAVNHMEEHPTHDQYSEQTFMEVRNPLSHSITGALRTYASTAAFLIQMN
jgi:translation elongation factor EF-1alpha